MPPRPDSQTTSSSALIQSQGTGGPSPSKKWEPLRPAEDRDPFALGDSDDEDGRDDLYGTKLVKVEVPPVATQEYGIIPNPLEPAVEENTTKTK